MVGNKAFSLSVATTAKPSASLIGFAAVLGPPIPIGNCTILLQAPVGITPLTKNGSNYTLALPVPLQTAFCGLTVFAQSVHQDTTGLASTPALRITVQ